MEEAYLITIETKQHLDGGEEFLDMTTGASLEGTEEDYTIVYTDASGDLAGTVIRLHVEKGEKITIIREGDYHTNLVLEPGVRHQTLYQTPFGSFMVGVSALEVDSTITQSGGKLRFRYCTDADLVPIGEVTFNITLKPRSIGG